MAAPSNGVIPRARQAAGCAFDARVSAGQLVRGDRRPTRARGGHPFDTITTETSQGVMSHMAETYGELRQELKSMATRLADFGRSL